VTRSAWRLIVDAAQDGASNMATDEAMLDAYDGDRRHAPPTLRLYGWRPAALSLGRNEASASAYDPQAAAREGIDVVRRPTGGSAVLHELERTYAIAGARGTAPFDGGALDLYRAIASALVRALARLGVAAAAVEPGRGAGRRASGSCFETTGAWEIAAGGRKIVGSAQARRRRSFLQHGSIPIRLEPERLASITGVPVSGDRFTDLERASGGPLQPALLDRALIAGFEETFGAAWTAEGLSESEALRAAELRCWKYDSIAWTRDATIGAREARWGPPVAR